MTILAFLLLLVAVVAVMFFPFRQKTTFSDDEMKAFRHAEQVKKELADVQAMIGPSKAPYTVSIGGSEFGKKPEPPNS
jgi:hypothetical protein